MAMLTVRNLPAEVHRALRVRAAQHGHSMRDTNVVSEPLRQAPETRVIEWIDAQSRCVRKLQRIDRLELRLTQL